MNTKRSSIASLRWLLPLPLLGSLLFTGCVVADDGRGRAYVEPAVIVAPEPVFVGPEVIVPVEVGGGDHDRRR